jgi:DNA-binding MarR family transcriptional regulator
MKSKQPFSVPLSQTLVAFTIEFDNEAEHRIPHWTTMSGKRHGVWLVSMVMWWNCMRYVGDEPIGVKELARRARTTTNLHGMQRWGYITVDPAPPKLIRATAKGLGAREIWAPLPNMVEKRWQERFGKAEVSRLRDALHAIAAQFEIDLPDCLPILGYGLFSAGPGARRETPVERDLPLCVLLSRALLAFAMDFEREFDLSLAICANIVRVLDDKGVRLRDIPQLSGVSKESIAMAMGILRKQRLAVVEKDPAGARAQLVRLTPQGREAQAAYLERMDTIESQWQERFGKQAIRALHEALEPFTIELLLRGVEPYPEGWRALVRKPSVLPHFPMVLHRGGYPDGS